MRIYAVDGILLSSWDSFCLEEQISVGLSSYLPTLHSGSNCACLACSGSSAPAILVPAPSVCVYLVLWDPHACNLHLTVPYAAHAIRTASYCLSARCLKGHAVTTFLFYDAKHTQKLLQLTCSPN